MSWERRLHRGFLWFTPWCPCDQGRKPSLMVQPPMGPSATGHHQRNQFQSAFLPQLKYVLLSFFLNFILSLKKKVFVKEQGCVKQTQISRVSHPDRSCGAGVQEPQTTQVRLDCNHRLSSVGSNPGSRPALRVVQGRLKEWWNPCAFITPEGMRDAWKEWAPQTLCNLFSAYQLDAQQA